MPTYRVTVNGNEYTVVVPDPQARPVVAIVNGETIEVNVENNNIASAPSVAHPSFAPVPEVVRKPAVAGPPASTVTPITSKQAGSSGAVKSPLPGIIVSIGVSEGDRVERGQELCVLEAMKMNNPIRSTLSGTVTKIFVSIGQQVQHGVPLMSIEV